MQITILAERLAEARKELEKLTRRANRAGGVEPITYSISAIREEQRVYDEWDGSTSKRMVPVIDITFEGTAPQVDGYQFLARITHDREIGNIVQTAPGVEDGVVDPKWRTADSTCDHCNRKRSRNDTFVLQNTKTGAQINVGRSCLRDFTGIDSPERVLAKFSYSKMVRDLSEECGRYSWHVGILKSLECASIVIRMCGWCPNSRSDEHTDSTAQLVNSAMLGQSEEAKRWRKQVIENRKPEDLETASAALEWIRNEMPVNSDYQDNLKKICSADGCSNHRYFGTMISGLPAYYRHIERKLAYTRQIMSDRQSKWQGKENERLRGLSVQYLQSRTLCHTDYGVLKVHKFKDADGNIFTWKTCNSVEAPINAHVKLDGTVKKHDEWNEIQQTLLTRVKIKEVLKHEDV